METSHIQCPKCGSELDVEEVISKRLETQFQEALGHKISELEKRYQTKEEAVVEKERQLQEQLANLHREIERKVDAEIQRERETLEKETAEKNERLRQEVEKKTREQYEVQIRSLEEAQTESQVKIATLKETLVENERLKRKLDAQATEIEEKINEATRRQQEIFAKESAEKAERLRQEVEKKAREQYEVQIRSLEEAQKESQEKITKLQESEIENERLKRRLELQRDELQIEYEKRHTLQLNEEKERIRKQEEEKHDLKIRELEKKLEDQTRLADEMKRKAEQGSTQLQGEVQELEIERVLCEQYERYGDEISEVKKGQRGADVLHIVRCNGQDCGKIYYESKRTKVFQPNWLQKFRDDNISVGADVLVLVTETMPPEHTKCYCEDGVWVCTLSEFRALSLVFREFIVKLHGVMISQEGVKTKSEMLYHYLSSTEFLYQFNAIIEGFTGLREGMQREKVRMEKIWKEREKQLEKILHNFARFYGVCKGIVGTSIPDVALLEDTEDSLPLLEYNTPKEP